MGRIIISSKRVFAILTIIVIFTKNNWALTIDNQLVSVKNDCFERIALGAMLPFDKTFRMEDTNSLKMCKEFCAKEGEKCQTIAFGVHARGNGTCQLSSEKIDASQTRPKGTIFDPDFDLYGRKINCFDVPPSENEVPTPGGFSDFPPESSRPPPLPFGSVGPTDNMPPSPSSRPTTTSMGTDSYPTDERDRYPGSSRYPSTDVNRYPPPTYSVSEDGNTRVYETSYPTRDPTTVYGDGEKYPKYDQNQNDYNNNQNRDKIYFSHDVYPLYKYPMLYEQNFPSPNEPSGYPGVYAQNVPTVEDRYRPVTDNDYNSRKTTPRPVFGLGYGNGYSYGTPTKYYGNSRPSTGSDYGGSSFDNMPNTRPDNNYGGGNVRPTSSYDSTYGSSQRPSSPYDSTYGSSQRPSSPYGSNNRPTYGQDNTRPTSRPPYSSDTRPPYNNGMDYYNKPEYQYQHRPDPVYSPIRPGPINTNDSGYGQGSSSSRPNNQGSTYGVRPISDTIRPGYGSNGSQSSTSGYGGTSSDNGSTKPGYGSSSQEGNYHVTQEPIETYFNPDDYYETKWTTKPGGGSYSGGSGSGSTSGYGSNRYPDHRSCFRRVLAGKRIAPHWVRRTLACERVEDCMQECGHEKRFTCEGFNYRLDPSGHGQGDCELIEVPLSQMDLYSSTNNRDSNLIRHPDYDYYERDRNAPASCRPSACTDCSVKPIRPPSDYYRPNYRPDDVHPPSGYDYGTTGGDRYRPSDTAIDKYRPSRPGYDYHQYDYSISPHSGTGYDSSYRPEIDRYDITHPGDSYRPSYWQVQPPSGHGTSYGVPDYKPYKDRPDYSRPSYRPTGSDYPSYRPTYHGGGDPYLPSPPGSSDYLDRDRTYKKPSRYVPYLIGVDDSWGSYGGSYGGGASSYNKNSHDYWGIRNDNRRHDSPDFNYFELGNRRNTASYGDNNVWSYPGSRYGYEDKYGYKGRPSYNQQWTRRPGVDECSAKSSEGFRLHKGVVRNSINVPTITECERMCFSENKFTCHTYSYRYTTVGRENCLLCDRPYNNLDYYADIEPDRDFDIYSMSDDHKACRPPPGGGSTAIGNSRNNAQCFFRAIDATRFFKSIVRDSLNVRSVGECELECIKSSKFTCRAFAYRYGQRIPGGVIDNCQLTDWPVRDMDKERHLIVDAAFDVFERASYGHGCEIQPIVDDKHKKLCYLGYGSSAKLLSTAIKKVISVPTEVECKNECIRYREDTPFKCYSFSFGSHASTFNCEMSDLDQTELKLNIHYAHTNDRDYWLFAWNPFDWTCRDKVTTIGGNRVNNDRRMDIFREPGEVTWRHYTVSGKPCRVGSGCDKNLITGFYSCELDGGEVGSWDYCCKAEHPCGYSQGFEYPWCYVGDEADQWRKCSDRYFPGNSSRPHPGIQYSPKDKKKHDQYQRPPRPGGLQSVSDFSAARLWPVTYLYTEGPPNSTELSNFVDCNKETC